MEEAVFAVFRISGMALAVGSIWPASRSTRAAMRPLTAAMLAPEPVSRGQRAGHGSLPSARGTGGAWLLPTDWPTPPDPGEEMMVGETIRPALPSACPSTLCAPGQAEGTWQRHICARTCPGQVQGAERLPAGSQLGVDAGEDGDVPGPVCGPGFGPFEQPSDGG